MFVSLGSGLEDTLGVIDSTWIPLEPEQNLPGCRRTIYTAGEQAIRNDPTQLRKEQYLDILHTMETGGSRDLRDDRYGHGSGNTPMADEGRDGCGSNRLKRLVR